MELHKLLLKSAGDRTKLIDNLLAALEDVVGNAQEDLLQRVVTDWVNKLDTDDTGKIKNTLNNKRLLATIDTVFSSYVKNDGVKIAKEIVDGVRKVVNFNGAYFKQMTTGIEVNKITPLVNKFIQSWLGLNGNGWLEGNGYLAKLINDPKVLQGLKDMAVRAITGQQGHDAFRSQLKDFIVGNRDKTGILERYYRNFVYDTYSQVDRATSKVYAQKLGLAHALYEGGLIKTSRKFCKEHNGNVYTTDEIAMFDPKVAIPDNYDPFTDMGGYGCRHHWNWLPETVANVLRPDLVAPE